MQRKTKSLFITLFIIILSYWSYKSLFISGYFSMHDDTQPSRIYLMAESLKNFQFPVRWVNELGYGYGYPLFNFYAPLPYYLGGLIYLLGINIITATKITFLIGIVLSGFTMYLLTRRLASTLGALLGAALYVYAPYHAINIYVRGALGELFAYAFLPLVGLGIYKISHIKDRHDLMTGLFIGSTGLAAILLSHNILGLLTLFFFTIYLAAGFTVSLWRRLDLKPCYYLLLILFFGMTISSFYTLPAIMEKEFTNVESLTKGGSDYHQHFPYLDQLWSSPWGFAGSAPGRDDGMSFRIGKIHLFLALFSVAYTIYSILSHKIKKESLFPIIALILFTLLTIFLMLDYSVWIWEKIPLFSYIQFPWRLLNFTILGISLTIIMPLKNFTQKRQKIILLSLILITVVYNGKFFTPREFVSNGEAKYIDRKNLNYQISKTSDEYLPLDFDRPGDEKEYEALKNISSSGFVKKVRDQVTYKTYLVDTDRDITYISDTAFFPGWQAYLNDKRLEIIDYKGISAFKLPPGKYELAIKLDNTPIRSFSNSISILGLFLLVYVTLIVKKTHEK